MKILIITEEFGKSANGLVAENIAKGLVKDAEVDVITDQYSPLGDVDCNVFVRRKYNKSRIQFLSVKYLGLDILSHWWPLSMPPQICRKYDLILSIVSMGHYASMRIGRDFKTKYGGRFFAYFVDAVPAPVPFRNDLLYIDKVGTYIRKYCDNVEVIFSATQEMSDYQKSIIENPEILFSELYNPSKTNELVSFREKSNDIVFTYTGNIYPPRNPKYILEAFSKLLETYPNAKLQIIGNRMKYYFDSFTEKLPQDVQKQILKLPFQPNLQDIFQNSTALIDLGCEVENDVYMSNKINGYFSYCRPIICETSAKSPAARIFKDMKSVLLCNHNADDIYKAMIQVVTSMEDVDYTERYRILNDMSISGVSRKIISFYEK